MLLSFHLAQVSSLAPWLIFTPLDLGRVRLQMQGELRSRGSY